MNLKWEGHGVSTSEEALEKIAELPQPGGIMLFGADSWIKDVVWSDCLHRFPNFAIGHDIKGVFIHSEDNLNLAQIILENGHPVLARLAGSLSDSHKIRHELVTTFRENGAESVVGIYAKCEKPEPLPGRFYLQGEILALAKQVQALEENPPTADGLDLFLTVTAEKGEF